MKIKKLYYLSLTAIFYYLWVIANKSFWLLSELEAFLEEKSSEFAVKYNKNK